MRGEGEEELMLESLLKDPLALVIVAGLFLVMVSFPLTALILPPKIPQHIAFHCCVAATLYFGWRGVSSYACITCIPVIFLGIMSLNDYDRERGPKL